MHHSSNSKIKEKNKWSSNALLYNQIEDRVIYKQWSLNRNNHQKPTFHPLGDCLNPALALLGQGLKKSPIGQKLDFVNHPYFMQRSCLSVALGKYQGIQPLAFSLEPHC
jgi:hypothetical protein